MIRFVVCKWGKLKMSNWQRKKYKWKIKHVREGNEKKNKKTYYSVDKKQISTPNRYVAPEIFSLQDNTEETMCFFRKIVDDMNYKIINQSFFIDSSKVVKVTVDALIYLIALMKNAKLSKGLNYRFRGNFPVNEDALKVYQESGFMEFVKSNLTTIPQNSEKFKIITHHLNRPELSKKVCEFAMDKLGMTRVETSDLQRIFIELMSNVVFHAYNDTSGMKKSWYLYAEHINNYIKIVFVDTGLGIAETVRKNQYEKMIRLLGIGAKDGVLMKSAFEGKFRTKTEEKHRGNGLKYVRDRAVNGLFRNFKVISGKGQCWIDKKNNLNGKIKERVFNESIWGTIYTFDFGHF